MFGIEGLTHEIFTVLGILVLAFILFMVEIIRVDVVACLILLLLGVTQLVPEDRLFSGFSSNAVIALIGVMIIGRGLERAGVLNAVTHWILQWGEDKEPRIRILLMFVGGIFSGFMRSVGTVGLFLPIITRIRHTTGIAKANLLMPLGYCAILGSTLTLVGSGPLILINSLLTNLDGLHNAQGQPVDPLGLFVVLPVGLALLLMGMLYFWFFGKWLLPNLPKRRLKSVDAMDYFKRMYGVGGDIIELRVPSTSSLSNNTLKQWEAIIDPSICILGIKDHSKFYFPPLRKDEIKVGSVVVLLGPTKAIEQFAEKFGLKQHVKVKDFKDKLDPLNAGLCEAVVPPSSPLVGKDFKELHMRKKFSAQVLAVLRGDKVRRGAELKDLNIRPGDTLGMFCSWDVLSDIEKNPDFAVVTTDYPHERVYTDKAGHALVLFFITLGLLIFSKMSIALCLMLGAMGMVFTKVLSIDEAYQAVSWKTVFLLAGLLPLGIAVELSGTSEWITEYFLDWFSHMPMIGIEFILALVTILFSLVLSNVGATILLVPMAVDLAEALQLDPRYLALLVALNASNSFISPTHQANALIAGPGRYRTFDFIKTGAPLTLLYIIISIVGLRLIFSA